MARVQVVEETTTNPQESGWTLWFQWCRYIYDNGDPDECGYRFIWRRPQSDGGSLQAARGQARIPSVALLERLVAQAKAAGWGHYDADADDQSRELEAAARRLRAEGLIVDLERGYVGWPNQEEARAGQLTPSILADEKLIREHSSSAPRRKGDALPVAGNIAL